MEMSRGQVTLFFGVLATLSASTSSMFIYTKSHPGHPQVFLSGVLATKRGVGEYLENLAREDQRGPVDFDDDTDRGYRKPVEDRVKAKLIRNAVETMNESDAPSHPGKEQPSRDVTCHEMPMWAWGLIWNISHSNIEDTYYHVPRSPFVLGSVRRLLCHQRCPVQLRVVPPESDRLWPRNIVEAVCACDSEGEEAPCSSLGPYICQQKYAKVIIVPALSPGEHPRYCTQRVKAGCRCEPINISPASMFELFVR